MSADDPSLLDVAWPELARRLAGCEREVALAAPFMSLAVARQIVAELTLNPVRQRRCLVALSDQATGSGYLDPLAVQVLIDAGFEVRSVLNLHAKVILIDRSWGLVGSGNLTSAGLRGGNVELGVVLRPGQRESVRQFFDGWWEQGLPVTSEQLAPFLTGRKPQQFDGGADRGYGSIVGVPLADELRDQITRVKPTTERSGRWLKMLYGRGSRDDAYWSGTTWISDAHRLRDDGTPTHRPSYEIGDRLVFYVTPERRCPTVAEVTAKPQYRPDLVKREGELGDWERWSWVTPVQIREYCSLDAGPTLSDLGVPAARVRQQGHVRLSEVEYRRALKKIEAAGRSPR